MIKPGEIQLKARQAGVRDQQIEKDYILSWLLQGVAQHNELNNLLVFKGGTVLKKVYFENYRFSEDLDFTLADTDPGNEQIFLWCREVFEYIREEANIRLEIIDDNQHEDGGINFYISYVGPLGGQGSNKKVKVDISRSETMVFAAVRKPVLILYSDLKDHQLLCYPLDEILVEKMRCVMQRMQARDFYDIWYLLEIHEMDAEYFKNEFAEKCKAKGLSSDGFSKKLVERIPQYKGRWQASISEQVKGIPDFEQVQREVLRGLKGIVK